MKKILSVLLALTMSLSLTTMAWADGGKGSAANPYTLAEFNAMTRADYKAAQETNTGTIYVTVGDLTYTAGAFTLGNGVRDDTPGQAPDHSKMNAYGENGYLGEQNDGANGHTVIFVNGTITSGSTGYESIDSVPAESSLLLAVPAYTTVKFEGITFNNVFSFNYQLYTSPWSQLGGLEFKDCTFNGIIVGAIASQSLTFDHCTFANYTNSVSANNSNPTWIRPAYGNWTKEDNEGQGGDFRSLTSIVFKNNTVTSTRPVKFERIAQWEMNTTVTVTGNSFDISAQNGDTSTKNIGLYLGADAKFALVMDSNTKSGNTAALVTAVYKDAPGLPEGSTVKDSSGSPVELPGQVWKSNESLTLETQYDAMVNGTLYANLSDAIAAAGQGETVKLMRSKRYTDDLTIDSNITIDLNGKNVVFTSNNGLTISAGKTLTLKDEAGEGSIRGINGTVVAAEGSTLVVDDGVYTVVAKTPVTPVDPAPVVDPTPEPTRPVRPEHPARRYPTGTTTATGTETAGTDITSAKTFDAGIALYIGMSALSLSGSVLLLGKKKEF